MGPLPNAPRRRTSEAAGLAGPGDGDEDGSAAEAGTSTCRRWARNGSRSRTARIGAACTTVSDVKQKADNA